jgi:hypothetical protein
MKSRLRGTAAITAFLAAAIGSAIAASSASAVLQTLPNGQIASYLPTAAKMTQLFPNRYDQALGNLDYNGGPVMPANTDYLIAWSPTGVGAYGSSAYLSGLATYWKDLQADSGKQTNVDSTSAQYGDASGVFARYKVTFGGLIVDTDPYPASQCPAVSPVTNCLTDAQIQAEVEKVAAANHIPHDLSHELFIVTPPHVEGCFTSNPASNPPYGGCSAGEPAPLGVYCAYHQQTALTPTVFYSDDPYVTGNSGCDSGHHPNGPSDGAIDGGMAHEHNESITDPIPNDAWTQGYGGPNSTHGEENGDLCAHTYIQVGTHNGVPYTQVINGHYYYYQPMWSNDGHTCLNSLTLPTLPKATFTAAAGSGLAMNFNASGSGPSIADFSWQFNDSAPGCTVTCNNTIETTSPTISHTFPAAGDYSVGLAVLQSNGTSAGVGGIIATGKSGFVPGFTASTTGLKASFKGLTNISRQAVTNYLWEFGDGATGTGATPTHTYAKAGTYKVTVVEFSGVGSAFPGSGAAPVYAKAIAVT